MSGKAPVTSIADLIRVAGFLDADASTLRQAAVMLGLAMPAVEPIEPPAVADSLPLPEFVPATRSSTSAPVEAAVHPATADPRQPRRVRLTPLEPANTAPPRALRGSIQDLLPSVLPSGPAEPLFKPAHQRTILSTLASTRRPGRDVDVPELVARTARREPIGRVPFRMAATTGLGVRLLVDHGPTMGPFRHDLRVLADALCRVVGDDAVDVLAFRGDISRVIRLSEDSWRDHPAVSGGQPVLLATDLGIATSAGTVCPADWLAFAKRVTQFGSPLVILVPYPPSRWPEWTRSLTLVHWDRPTSAQHAQQAVRRAARLTGVHR